MKASWLVQPWSGSPGIKIASSKYKNCTINKKKNMKINIIKKQILTVVDEVGVIVCRTLSLICSKVGYKVTAF